MSSPQAVIDLLHTSKTLLVVCHQEPDGDSIGSAIGLALLFEQLGGRASFYAEDPISRLYRFLPRVEEFRQTSPEGAYFDLAAALDCGAEKRLGDKLPFRKIAKRTLNIDHHLANGMFGDVNYVEITSSTAELVYRVCKAAHILTPDIATCLYTGVMMDTGNFRYDNATLSTFEMVLDLVRAGASPHRIALHIYENRTYPSVKLLGYLLSTAELYQGGKVACGVITQDALQKAGAESQDFPQATDHLRSIEGVEIAVLFREEEDSVVKVHFRAKTTGDVQKIAKCLGGGGHRKAAGCTLKGRLEDVKKRVLEEVFAAFPT